MNEIFAVLMATLSGVAGTGLGGLAGCFGAGQRGRLSAILGFTSGLMTAVVCFSLLPEAVALANIPVAIVGLAVGATAVALFSRLLPGEPGDLEHTSYLVLLAIALHNLPEGLAIGSGWAVMPSLGLKLALVIGAHDFPEGMAITAPLMACGQARPLRATLWALLTGVPTGFGALIGYWLGSVSPDSVALCMGFAAGAMSYVTMEEMVPRMREAAGAHKTFWQLLGLAAGMAISLT